VVIGQDEDWFRGTVLALRARHDFALKLMRELELEMASLSDAIRRERKSEFDARLIALMNEQDNIAIAASAFLGPANYPTSGNA
jgi:hypothetical protein